MNRNILAGLLFLTLLTGCSSPDDFTGEEQPDDELSLAERTNIWIYNHMNHYYLWRDDLPDSLSCDFTLTPTQFFETLLSDKDRFSYVGFASRRGLDDIAPDYGFAYQRMTGTDHKEYLCVLYVTSGQARQAGISRGDLLLPRRAGSGTATFDVMEISDSGLTPQRTVELSLNDNMSRAADTGETVYIDSIYNINGKKVGYMCYLEFDKAKDFYGAMNRFADAGIDEMVLDLRYNPGGYERTCKTLCNSIVSPSAYEKIFVKHSYNDIVAAENLSRYGDELTYTYFTTPRDYGDNVMGETCPPLGLRRVFVLTSRHSASSSELAVISLRPYMDVVVIGENSTGKGVGMEVVSIPNFNYALAPITFRFYNALGETVPETGIAPDYNVPDGYLTNKRDLGDTEEPMLKCALNIIAGQSHDNLAAHHYFNTRARGPRLTPTGEPSFVTRFNHKRQCRKAEQPTAGNAGPET